ncbi:MAG: CocE/NonD family hydrolase C-terminal non-catalytic domain-containing protein, partial [Vicinamibacterales bacterium]|nr:CocE/NonD family hydrolase C-terminal non-catalytic domain-containing protein [Vicinamibacterales bacterium]
YHWPTATPGKCGWPVVVLVPGLAATHAHTVPEAAWLARHGFFVVSYDVRAQGSARLLDPAKGSMFWAIDEWIDMAEVIEWVEAKYPTESDTTRVSVIGDSQGAVHAWAAAAFFGKAPPPNSRRTRPFPPVKCVVPRLFAPQVERVFVPQGNSFLYWLPQITARDHPHVQLDGAFRKKLEEFLDRDDAAGLSKYLNSVNGKDLSSGLRTTTVPILHISSWLDQFMGVDLSLKALASLPAATPRRLYIMTGYHGTPLHTPQTALRQELTLDWLRRFQKGGREPVEKGPPVLAYALPPDPQFTHHPVFPWRLRAYAAFPPPDAKPRKWFLRSAERLEATAPKTIEGPALIKHTVATGYDVRDYRKDDFATVLRSIPWRTVTFTTPSMTEAVEIAGKAVAQLEIQATKPGVQIGARLSAVTPAGAEQPLAVGGFETRNASTNGWMIVRVELGTTVCVLPKGYRLRLQLMNQVVQRPGKTDYHRYVPRFTDFDVKVGFRPDHPSWLEVPLRSVSPDLSVPAVQLSLSAPLKHTLTLRSAPSFAGSIYVLCIGITGQGPPVPIGSGQLLWLVPDFMTDLLMGLVNGPILPGFVGILNQDGAAQAKLNLAPLAPLPSVLLGVNLHIAPLLYKSGLFATGAPVQVRFR